VDDWRKKLSEHLASPAALGQAVSLSVGYVFSPAAMQRAADYESLLLQIQALGGRPDFLSYPRQHYRDRMFTDALELASEYKGMVASGYPLPWTHQRFLLRVYTEVNPTPAELRRDLEDLVPYLDWNLAAKRG
jgi:hypothetical protein